MGVKKKKKKKAFVVALLGALSFHFNPPGSREDKIDT